MLQEEKDGEGNCDSVKDSVAAAASWSDMAVQLEVETTVKTRRRKWWRDGGGGLSARCGGTAPRDSSLLAGATEAAQQARGAGGGIEPTPNTAAAILERSRSMPFWIEAHDIEAQACWRRSRAARR